MQCCLRHLQKIFSCVTIQVLKNIPSGNKDINKIIRHAVEFLHSWSFKNKLLCDVSEVLEIQFNESKGQWKDKKTNRKHGFQNFGIVFQIFFLQTISSSASFPLEMMAAPSQVMLCCCISSYDCENQCNSFNVLYAENKYLCFCHLLCGAGFAALSVIMYIVSAILLCFICSASLVSSESRDLTRLLYNY